LFFGKAAIKGIVGAVKPKQVPSVEISSPIATTYDINKLHTTQPAELLNQGQVKNFMETIQTHGVDSVGRIPIHVHKGKALIVDGHHRVAAFKKLGYKRIPVQYIQSARLKKYYRILEDMLLLMRPLGG